MQELLQNPDTQSPFLPGTTEYNRRSLAIMLGLIGAGAVYIILSLVIRRAGVRKVRKFFPSIVVGPVIVVIGLSLAGVVMVFYIFKSPCIPWHSTSAAIITGVTIILVNAIAKSDSFVKVVPIIFGLLVGYVYSVILSLLTPDGSVPLIKFETMFTGDVVVFQQSATVWGFWGAWGDLDGDLISSAFVSIVPVAFVSFMEHLGDISVNSLICGIDFFEDPGLDRTVLGDGVATIVSALLGGPGNTTYGENTAVLAITKNYNAKNILLSGIFAVVLGMFVPFGEFLGSIPLPVVGGAGVVLFGMVAANGLRALVDAKVDFGDTKNLTVVSVTLTIGVGLEVARMSGFPIKIGNIAVSSLAISTLLAIVMNLIIPHSKPVTGAQEDAEERVRISVHDMNNMGVSLPSVKEGPRSGGGKNSWFELKMPVGEEGRTGRP